MDLDKTQQAAQAQFGKQSHKYGRGHILENTQDVADAVSKMQLPPVADVLDVATGAGHTGLYLAGLGHSVTVTDLAVPMLERAQELAQQKGLAIKTCQHAAEKFPYNDASFDLVTCRVAAHHFSSPPKFVEEVSRVLRPEGYFLLVDGSVEDDQEEAEEWIHQVEKLRDPSHNRFLTPGTWKHLCAQNGLSVLEATLHPMKQPDLEWYFEAAATLVENREKVRQLIQTAPHTAKELFQLGEKEGKIIWWWQRLTLIARK